MTVIRKARILLIRLGKKLPFVYCGIVLISYAETIFGIMLGNVVQWSDFTIPNKPILHYIGKYAEYELLMLLVLCVLSVAIETCIFNKLACGYLGVNLAEKSYFDFELEPTAIYIICLANIIIAGWLTFKGIKIILTSK